MRSSSGATPRLISCCSVAISPRRVSEACVATRNASSALRASASHSTSILELLSLRCRRRVISSTSALFRCWMLVYCVFRPCLARSWSRCASATCFRCTSSRRRSASLASFGCATSSSRVTAWASFSSFFTSACAASNACRPACARLRSSSSSKRARVRSSKRADLARSASSRSDTSRKRFSDACCTSASMSPSFVMKTAASRCAS
mmetsp:Transcript_47482/g.132385  ORF Transcript_47482/g.132385 Transcript_47482/m.132385 type:complete len:206 (+) Transcript_47482:2053-2670(+)